MTRLFCAFLLFVPMAAAAAARIDVVVAVEDDGTASELWGELLRRHGLSESAAAEAVALWRPLSAAESAWVERIRGRAAADWPGRLPELAELFAPVEPPAAIRVVLGNRGGEDAFTHDPATIGFDVSKLVALYGDAGTEENRDRLERLFAHETVHLLQKAWYPAHPQPESTPFELAELEIWSEGLGNYYSMSPPWRAEGGRLSARASAALAWLEPRFVDRLTALACATPAAAERLTADLSNGPFAEKWGALTAALWLDQEASTDSGVLRRFARSGAAGVRELARRHLSPQRFAELERARRRSRDC